MAFFVAATSRGGEAVLELQSTDGKRHKFFSEDGGEAAKAVVLIFTATDCPVANYFQPTIRRLEETFASQGVRFFQVYPDRDTTVEAAKKHAEDYGIQTPQVLDPKQKIADQAEAMKTPEAVVYTADGKKIYLGRIDDTYASLGKKRPNPKTHDLHEAIGRALSGAATELVETEAVGCFIFFEDD
ncbi:MAG: redoxin domain-containing protein [Verrucomicrobiota bacterium]